MKPCSIALLTSLFLITSCGMKERKENNDLRDENDQLRAEVDSARKEQDEAKKKAEASGQLVSEQELKLAEAAKQLDAVQAERVSLEEKVGELTNDLETIRTVSANSAARLRADLIKKLGLAPGATDAQIITALQNKIDTYKQELAAKDAEIAALKTQIANGAVREEIAVAPFNGIWIIDDATTASVPSGCHLMVLVASKKATVSRALVCDNGNAQLDTYSPSDYGVRSDLFPNSLGFAVVTTTTASTCTGMTSTLAESKEFVFDHSTSAGAERADYMFASYGDKNIIFQSGSARTELERNKSCETIQARAAESANAGNKLLQAASRLCRGDLVKKGCFTSAGFKPAQ